MTALPRSIEEDRGGFLFLRLSLLQAVDGVMSLALCLQVVSQVPQHFRSSETQATRDALPTSLSDQSFLWTLACPGKHTHRSLRTRMSKIVACQSVIPIPLVTFLEQVHRTCGDGGEWSECLYYLWRQSRGDFV